MDRIERILWVGVAVVFGNLGGTAYQKYIVPKATPVKYEQKGVRKVAEGGTAITCVTKEVGQSVLDAYTESQEVGEITLWLLIMLGACSIEQPEPKPVNQQSLWEVIY